MISGWWPQRQVTEEGKGSASSPPVHFIYGDDRARRRGPGVVSRVVEGGGGGLTLEAAATHAAGAAGEVLFPRLALFEAFLCDVETVWAASA